MQEFVVYLGDWDAGEASVAGGEEFEDEGAWQGLHVSNVGSDLHRPEYSLPRNGYRTRIAR